MEIDNLIEAHAPHVALQFSGGRDSIAMLLHLRKHWDKLTVYFCNSGDAFPETIAMVEAVRRQVPCFVEVQGRVQEVRKQFGWPSDLLPASATWPAASLQVKDHLPLIGKFNCCYLSLMEPLHERMKSDGIKLILRGQRDTDEPRSHVKNGESIGGFVIGYPLQDWTTADVTRFIEASGIPVPPFYAMGATSCPDCMHCTAWIEHGAHKYLDAHYPEASAEVKRRLRQIKIAVEPAYKRLNAALGEQ